MPGCLFKLNTIFISCLTVMFLTGATVGQTVQRLGGTLVVAVPVSDGLVVCSDKRLYNEATGASRDDFVKIHPAGDKALFVATHSTGFLNKTTGKMEFDIFELTHDFVSRNGFAPSQQYWSSLRSEIRSKLSAYLSRQKFKDLPETDLANNMLLFNLVFFAIEGGSVKDYSLSVFYERAQVPIINVANVVSEFVKNPKLLGKGKDVMALFAKDSSFAQDPSILKFDQSYFNIARTSASDAVTFASRLFTLTNQQLPQARVSAAHDCIYLSYRNKFKWLDDSGLPMPDNSSRP